MKLIITGKPVSGGKRMSDMTGPKGSSVAAIIENQIAPVRGFGAFEEVEQHAANNASALGRLVEVLCDKFALTGAEAYYIATGGKAEKSDREIAVVFE